MTATAAPTSTTGPKHDSTMGAKPSSGVRWNIVGLYVGIAFIVLWCLLPAYWMFATSLRDPGSTFDTSIFPSSPTLTNYRTAFSTGLGNHFGRALLNSIFIGVFVTGLSLAVGVFAAYAMARLQFRGKFAVLGALLAASMFPGVALVTPLFQLFTNLHWIGKFQALIIPDISFSLPLTVWILTSFFAEMPWELEQAAKVDGATPGQAFRLVILPLTLPGLFTTAILVFIGSWNEYLLASILSQGNKNVAPVTVAIAKFTGAQAHQEPYTAVMAAGFVVAIPLIIVVLIFQRRIVSGLTAGGVKG